MLDTTPPNGYGVVNSTWPPALIKSQNKLSLQVPHQPKRFGELLLIVPALHIAKEALQFRYSTYQQFD